MPPVNSCPSRSGFSLIEVLLAIGLVTFVLLVIFSLMPTGIATLQSASRQIVETEIYNAYGAELAATPFSQLTNYVNGTNFPAYFDNEGNKTDSGKAVFTVRCSLEGFGSTNAGLNSELSRAIMRVGYHYDPAGANDGGSKVSRRAFILVNSGT